MTPKATTSTSAARKRYETCLHRCTPSSAPTPSPDVTPSTSTQASPARSKNSARQRATALLDMLYQHIAHGVKFQIRVHWEPNTVVFWDNRCVQHYAAFDYFPEVRHGYRATAIGEVPYLAH